MTAVRTAKQGDLVQPSPIFYAIVLATVFLGVALANGFRAGGLTMFLFIVVGWMLALTLHEFGHAIVAYIGGDRSVIDKGYLTLDVRKYADITTSLLFPIFILVIGGIGLPGGAVWINTRAIPSKFMRSLLSAAGPFATGLCAVICLVPVRLGLVESSGLVIGLTFLGWLQVIAMVFNLLPIPGLDGFGIIEPYMSNEMLRAIRPVRQYGIMILFVAIFFVEPVRIAFFDLTDWATELIGGQAALDGRFDGWQEFRFWNRPTIR